jgi:hypothetical protein
LTDIVLIHRRRDRARARQIAKVLYHLDLLVTRLDISDLADFDEHSPKLLRDRADTLALIVVSPAGGGLDQLEAWVERHAGQSHLALLAVGPRRPLRLPRGLVEIMTLDLQSDSGVIERDQWRVLAAFVDSRCGTDGLSDFIHALRHKFEGYHHDELSRWVGRHSEHRLADAILQLRTRRELGDFCRSLVTGLDKAMDRPGPWHGWRRLVPLQRVPRRIWTVAAGVLLVLAGAAGSYIVLQVLSDDAPPRQAAPATAEVVVSPP